MEKNEVERMKELLKVNNTNTFIEDVNIKAVINLLMEKNVITIVEDDRVEARVILKEFGVDFYNDALVEKMALSIAFRRFNSVVRLCSDYLIENL